MSRRIRHKRREHGRPLWVSMPGREGFILDAGDVPGPKTDSPNADDPARVYVLLSEGEEVLYVGQTRFPETRIAQHRRQQSWWPEVAHVLWEEQPTLRQALLRESELIHRLDPRYNAR